MNFAHDSILVMLETAATGGLEKSSAGLLAAAAAVGTPVALIVAPADAQAALAADAGALGAAAVLTAPLDDPSALTVPVALRVMSRPRMLTWRSTPVLPLPAS